MRETTIDGYRVTDDGARCDICCDGDPCGVGLSAGELFSFLGQVRGTVTVRGGPRLPSGVVHTIPEAWLDAALDWLDQFEAPADLRRNLRHAMGRE